ncbi:MAG TPA: CPBP family glutamic-type intramembrane protease [Polyangiaceae bacterium]|nr:CPBP family glutamic-type intramembrane protease [Polyangiaceae bacterium]
MAEAVAAPEQASKSDPWSDLALTLPLFVVYHLGVVFLPVRNAADIVTLELVKLADNDLLKYSGLTLAIGVVFVTVLAVLGRHRELRWQRFAWAAAEAVLYAVAMRLAAGYVVGKLRLAADTAAVTSNAPGVFAGIVLAVGAGFYEEIAFRVVLFALGAKIIRLFAEPIPVARARLITFCWAFVAAGIFSGWHYVGALGDPFELKSFVFRWVCGLAFTVIYAFRGFGPAVWTHAIYDSWVLVL